jgi:hypothetical protein
VGCVADRTPHDVDVFISTTVPCNFSISVSVYVGKKEIKISPDSFNLGPTGVNNYCYAGAAPSSRLKGGELARDNLPGDKADIGIDLWILGDVFLQNVYSAWDMGSKNGETRIGFADLRNV